MNHDVRVGSGGWLFLQGGNNNPFDFLDGVAEFGRKQVDGWTDLLEERRRALAGLRYVHLFAPNKESIYHEAAGLSPSQLARAPLAALYRQATQGQREVLRGTALNPSNYFSRIKGAHQLYWKVDTHWSPIGCFAAYQLLCSALGAEPRKDLLANRPYGESVHGMDLGSKLDPPLTETVRFYRFAQEARRARANEIVELKEARGLENEGGLHVGSNVVFENQKAPDHRRLVLFGDSFSEYRTGLLTGMLAETFREVHFVWSVSLDLDYIGRHDPDVVVSEVVERFMPSVPHNRFDLAAYSTSKVADYTGRS